MSGGAHTGHDADPVHRNRSLGDRLTARLTAAADQLVDYGMIGVAARIEMPGEDEPLIVASGHRDLARTMPLDGGELFAIASQSKMFTAAMTMHLVKAGTVALDDRVSRYVPDVPAVDPEATIEQFLNHTSGIGNFLHAMPRMPYPWPSLSYDDLMAMARVQGRQFRAGERFEYNNTDVVVLARLCERVAGKPFAVLLKEHVLAPLGMDDTYVADGGEWPRDSMARGYYMPTQGYAGPPLDVAMLPDYSIASAAGNIVSSLSDMLRWARSLVTVGAASGLELGDLAASVTEARGLEPSWFFPRVYGRGIERWSWAGRRFWGHRGSIFGYHSGTFVDPATGGAFSAFLTMQTEGSFFRFIELQAHDYTAFLEGCANAISTIAESG